MSHMCYVCFSVSYKRVLYKFLENGCEKVDRLVELHLSYLSRVENVSLKQNDANDDDEEEEDDYVSHTERLYLQRLEAGLFTLQRVDLIIAHLISTETAIKDRFVMKLNEQGGEVKNICGILKEYSRNLGDGGEGEEEVVTVQNKIAFYCQELR